MPNWHMTSSTVDRTHRDRNAGALQHADAGGKPDWGDRVPFWQFGVGLFVCALLLRLASFTGLIASDDLFYSRYAQLMADGQYVPEYSHRAIRYGLLLPVGLLYRLIGVSEWSTIAVPLFASSVSVVLLALIAARLFGRRAAVIAALLLATFPLHLYFATVLVPEAVLGFYLLLALFVYVRTDEWRPLPAGALTGIVLGMAYLTKEPALFVAPALVIDAALRRRWRLALGVTVGLAVVIALEHGYYFAATGDLLFRPHALAYHNSHVPSLGRNIVTRAPKPAMETVPDAPRPSVETVADVPRPAMETVADVPRPEAKTVRHRKEFDLARRLFIAYPHKMLVPNHDFGIHSLVALILSGVALLRFHNDRRAHFLLLWASLPWIYLNFGTSSFTQYVTVPPASRYIDLTYPPLFLFAGWLFADLLSGAAWLKRLVLAVMTAVLLSGVAWGYSTRATEYRTDHVAVLRVIADQIEGKGVGVCFDDVHHQRLVPRWQSALFILSKGKLRECDAGSGSVTVRADQLGLPYVASRQP